MRELYCSINNRPTGVLRDRDGIWEWEYVPDWANATDTYDISPALPRAAGRITDDSTVRPVQFFFDNLLPEEAAREILVRGTRINQNDSFSLLQEFGAETAGALTLSDNPVPDVAQGKTQLTNNALSNRIRNLPQAPLNKDAPKKMSIAGAQHKLLVILDGDDLYEPFAGSVSTHILKPDSPLPDYPHTVANEYFIMQMAHHAQLDVPTTRRFDVPEPVYVIERFDRQVNEAGEIQRVHTLDGCQLLNKSRQFKYREGSIESLLSLANRCRLKASARLRIFKWLAFNLLVGNNDNHLKNLSFMNSVGGIHLSPWYDLLSTAVYETRAFADDQARWPNSELAIHLPRARFFSDISSDVLSETAAALGVRDKTAKREVERIISKSMAFAEHFIDANQAHAGESRLYRSIYHTIMREMAERMLK